MHLPTYGQLSLSLTEDPKYSEQLKLHATATRQLGSDCGIKPLSCEKVQHQTER